MTVFSEITERVYRDRYVISVRELACIYIRGDLHISNAQIQSVFDKWDAFQRSQIIEALLRKMPMTAMTIYQNKDKSWDVLDGLKRIVAIFQFLGILKDENGNLIKPYALTNMQILHKLNNHIFVNKEHFDNDENLSKIKVLKDEHKRAILGFMLQTDIVKAFGDDLLECQILKRCITSNIQ